jgi:hypothetical protein
MLLLYINFSYDIDEFEDFYDFSATYPPDEIDSDDDESSENDSDLDNDDEEKNQGFL